MRLYLNILMLLLLTVFVNSACQRNADEKPCDPALELYCRYADNTNLTVAYLSDFKIHGNDINTVMIQADDEDTWDWLLGEFAVSKEVIMGITGDTMSDQS